jgi:hypothetical protein
VEFHTKQGITHSFKGTVDSDKSQAFNGGALVGIWGKHGDVLDSLGFVFHKSYDLYITDIKEGWTRLESYKPTHDEYFEETIKEGVVSNEGTTVSHNWAAKVSGKYGAVQAEASYDGSHVSKCEITKTTEKTTVRKIQKKPGEATVLWQWQITIKANNCSLTMKTANTWTTAKINDIPPKLQ